jgi:DNA-binding MarR family transcriptional regulator
MSRGLGLLQHRVCDVIDDAEDQELPLRELRRRLGEPNRSNLRRAIRGLLERGILEEFSRGGEPHVAFAVKGYFGPRARPASSGNPPVFAGAGDREKERAVQKEWPGAARRRTTGRTARKQKWVRYEHRFVRNRPLGETQRRVLGALQESSEPKERGLPVTVVKGLVGTDRSNARRAIRTLLMRGLIEESEDGRRLRLTLLGAFTQALSA